MPTRKVVCELMMTADTYHCLSCDCRAALDLCSQVIKLLKVSSDHVSTDVLARAHLSTYLLHGPDQMDKVSLLISSLFYNFVKKVNLSLPQNYSFKVFLS